MRYKMFKLMLVIMPVTLYKMPIGPRSGWLMSSGTLANSKAEVLSP